MLKIATWNVNSIRARIPNFMEWLRDSKPDIVLLQELKCKEEQFPLYEFDCSGYNVQILGQKAINGVAIISKYPLVDVKENLPLYGLLENDSDSRYLEASIILGDRVIDVASVYVPNGSPSVVDVRNGIQEVTLSENFRRKMKFFDRLKLRLRESVEKGRIAIFGGDYNVCPNLSMDVYSPKKDGCITCTEEERKKFSELLAVGVVDLWRKINPNLREYSWWGYRPYFMWEKNQGFRLDALLTTPIATELARDCRIHSSETRSRQNASDHAPMVCSLEI